MNVKRGVAGVAVAVAVASSAAAAPGAVAHRSWTVRFGFVSQRAFQGQQASVSVLVRSTRTRCSLAVQYVNGTRQAGLAALSPAKGRVQWTWPVAMSTPAGPATAVVSCRKLGRLVRRFVVVGGTVVPSKLTVVTSGWSQRNDKFGTGSLVSYGLQLDNPSDSQDAKDVTVLVNLLDGGGLVLGSGTSRVPEIGAASIFNVGGSIHLNTQTPVSRLEIVVQQGSHVAHELHQPLVENIRIVPSQFEPNWVGEVDGDVVNDSLTDTLTRATLSIVLFDSAGNVVGGGTGFVSNSLPPGTRSFFKGSSGVTAVPTAKATTAVISVEPMYQPPGS